MKRKRSVSVSASSCSSRSIGVLAAAAAVFLCPPPAPAADPPPRRPVARIGVVDTRAVLDRLVSWQEVREQLRAERKKAEKTVKDKRNEMQRLRAELDYFKVGSRDRKEREARLARLEKELADLVTRLGRALEERARAALDATREEIRSAVRRFAVARGFDVVVDARAVFYVAGGADVSLEVAREMNRRYKERKAKKQPRQPSEVR